MSYKIKKLTISDWPDIEKLIDNENNFRIAQTKMTIPKEEYKSYTYNSFLNNKEEVYAFITNEEIISITTVLEYEALPGYLLKNFRHFKKTNMYNPINNGLAPTLNQIIEIQEEKGLYTFWMAKTGNHKRLNQERTRDLMFNVGCPKLKNYELTIEEYVLANTKSKYRFHADGIYFGKILTEDTCVIKFTCRQEHRNNVDFNLSQKMINK